MAPIRIADTVFDDEIFREVVVEATTERSRLFQSGIIQTSAEFDAIARSEGKLYSLPYWKPLARTVQRRDDSSPLSVNKTTMDKDQAVKHFLGDAWAVNELAVTIAGSDPLQALGDEFGRYWDRVLQMNVLLPSLNGIFADTLSSTHVLDVSIEDGDNAGDANLIGADNIINAIGLLGDRWDDIVAFAVHSKPFQRLQKLGLIETEQLQDQNITINRYQGKEVIVDDGMPREDGDTNGHIYTTVFFGAGAVAFGDGGPDVDDPNAPFVETDRDSLAGDNILIHRRNLILHPRGVAFTGTPSGHSPSENELADGDNWTLKWDSKNVPMIALKTNG